MPDTCPLLNSRCPEASADASYRGVCRDSGLTQYGMDVLRCSEQPPNIGSNNCPAGQHFVCDGSDFNPKCVDNPPKEN